MDSFKHHGKETITPVLLWQNFYDFIVNNLKIKGFCEMFDLLFIFLF